jgi:hypothetical protein
MGGDRKLTKAGIEKLLEEALERYYEQEQAGADMAEAGEELAGAISGIVRPAPCGIPRHILLRDRQRRLLTGENVTVDLDTGQVFSSEGTPLVNLIFDLATERVYGSEGIPLDDLDG